MTDRPCIKKQHMRGWLSKTQINVLFGPHFTELYASSVQDLGALALTWNKIFQNTR